MATDSRARIGRVIRAPCALIARFRSCSAGATSLEYALIAVLFAVAALATWKSVGSSVGVMYNRIGTAVVNAN